jgi:hypothetical protein
MAGTSLGMGLVHFTGLRVAKSPTYTPSYNGANGKKVDQKLQVRCALNRKGPKNSDKKQDPVYIDLVMWGSLADTGARSCSKGKELHVVAQPKTYDGQIWKNKGHDLVTNDDGSALTITKTSYKVVDILFGEDSAAHIDGEIARGVRPLYWNRPDLDPKKEVGTRDIDIWSAKKAARKALQYDGSETFVFAKIETKKRAAAAQAQNLQSAVASATGTQLNPAMQQVFSGVSNFSGPLA